MRHHGAQPEWLKSHWLPIFASGQRMEAGPTPRGTRVLREQCGARPRFAQKISTQMPAQSRPRRCTLGSATGSDRGAAHNGTGGTAGSCMGYVTSGPPYCPQLDSSGWVDTGSPSEVGLAYCATTTRPLPPPYTPPVCDQCGPSDCGRCPAYTFCDGQKGGPGCGGCRCVQ
jgi:hypothetical protein